MLKELGYKGWVSGYYHENQYEECEGEDALEYYDYECIGNRSGFVNENTMYRAAAPTLVEAYQFLVEHGYDICVESKNGTISTNWNRFHYTAKTFDEAFSQLLNDITNNELVKHRAVEKAELINKAVKAQSI